MVSPNLSVHPLADQPVTHPPRGLARGVAGRGAARGLSGGSLGRNSPLARPRGAHYIHLMSFLLPALVIVAMLATLGVLFAGMVSMAKGGEFNRKHGNRLMRWRVILQGSALLLLAIALLLAKD